MLATARRMDLQLVRQGGVAALVLLATMGLGQGSRWQLGNPSLIIDMPGEASSGGVSWHDTVAIFPTSWSSESNDLRVEVGESYSSDKPQALATKLAAKLGGAAQGGRDLS